MAEIEARIETERHDGGCGVCRALAGEDRHLALVVHAGGVIGGGHGINLVEVIALDPVLKFAGMIAGVLADFEHGDDHDLDRDGSRGRGAACRPNVANTAAIPHELVETIKHASILAMDLLPNGTFHLPRFIKNYQGIQLKLR